MFLSKKYGFANEAEARSGLSGLLSRGSVDERWLFKNLLTTIFSARQELVERVHHRGVENNIGWGLPDICIPANEDTVIPALSAQGIGCCMEIRQYSNANQWPIVLSPYVTAYFSYSAGWLGTVRRDWIKSILVAHSQEKQHLLWNLTFDDLSSIELRCAERKNLRLAFLDGTDMLIPLDRYGYPLESEKVQYVKSDAQTQLVVKYTFRSSPTSSVMLPSPFVL